MQELKSIFALDSFDQLKALKLYVNQLVGGLMLGGHMSGRKGFGVEFKEYKAYAPGDDLRQLDWKYYAKTDHYYIREAEVENNHHFYLAIDQSRSMLVEQEGMSKFNVAKSIEAALAYVVLQQHDACHLLNVPANLHTLDDVLFQLISLETVPENNLESFRPSRLKTRRNTVFICSDLYAPAEHWQNVLKEWRYVAEEVVLIHLLFDQEQQLNYGRKNLRFQDLEDGKMVEVNTEAARKDYQERLNKWQQEVQDFCRSYQIQYRLYDGVADLSDFIQRIVYQVNTGF